MKEKYLLFYLKTGGGHLAPASSIANYYKNFCTEKVEPVLCDGLEGSSSWLKKIIEDGYKNSVNKAPWVFESLYALNKLKPVSKVTAEFVSFMLKARIREKIEKENPKKIINFHFLLIKPIKEIVKELGLKIPVLTVVTDPYSAHPIWFLEKEQNFIVFSKELQEQIKNFGIKTQKSAVFPFIVNEKFTKDLSEEEKENFRKEHNLSNKKTILILGGGDGMPRGEKILKRLIKAHLDSQIIIVCGRNEELRAKAEYYKQKYNAGNLHIFGFVPFVYELIQISEMVITKCGASTFMEILISGKVPIINNYIWEQEKGNMEYVRDNRMGLYEKRIPKLPNVIGNLLNDNIYASFKQNINKAGLTTGTKDVSNYIMEYQG